MPQPSPRSLTFDARPEFINPPACDAPQFTPTITLGPIQQIKAIRDAYGLSLIEAKRLIDNFHAEAARLGEERRRQERETLARDMAKAITNAGFNRQSIGEVIRWMDY